MDARFSRARTPFALAFAVLAGFALIQGTLLASIVGALRTNAALDTAADVARLAVREAGSAGRRAAASGPDAAAARRRLETVLGRLRPAPGSPLARNAEMRAALDRYAAAGAAVVRAPRNPAAVRTLLLEREVVDARLGRLVDDLADERQRETDRIMPSVLFSLTSLLIGALGAHVLIALPLERRAERSECELHESRQRLQSLFEEHLDPAIAIDLDGRYLMVNRELERLSGYCAQELVGMSIRTLVPAEYVDFVRSKQCDAIEGRPSEYEAVLVHKDGTRVDVQAKAFPMTVDGRAVGVYVILRDISAQRKIERRMHQQHEQFRSLFEHHSDAVVALDLAGRFARVNVATEVLTGFMDVELLGRPFDALFLLGELPGAADLFGRVLGGGAVGFEAALARKDGSRADVAGKMVPIFVNSTVTGAYAIFRDVTEERAMEVRERDIAERAIEASRLKSRFVATMSHELRTPLNAIIGMSELLVAGELVDGQRERADTIRGSAEALLAIVNDILDFSKLEAGKAELDQAEFAPRELVARCIEPLLIAADAKSVALESAFAPDVPEILTGDGGKLRQVITNLVANAIKFTECGTVSIALSLDALDADRAVVRLSVCDTGIGIAPNVADRLFSPFEQGDNSTNRRFGGTGLGLSICRALVELMDGRIGVESTLGEGSTFWFTAAFDRVRPRAAALPPPDEIPAAPAHAPSKLRILLVEDHPVNQRIALQQLRHLGFDASLARNGREALESLERDRFDLVFMDCHMPELDGYEATRTIRRSEAGASAHVRIVAMTANAFEGEREACLEAGMDDYLSKPVRLAELRAALERSLAAVYER